MTTAIIFIIILGILIFVHELGHFVTARRNGIKADEFGFGFPPRLFGFYRNEQSGKTEFVWGNKEISTRNTVYSFNWIPLGGFVRIKGENGNEKNEADSFASKSAWVRIKVLAAGVIMNFVLAWALFSFGFMIGTPEAIDPNIAGGQSSKIQISQVIADSPASVMGLQVGDEILKKQNGIQFESVKNVQEHISVRKGQALELKIKRGDQVLNLQGVPREDAATGRGLLGVSLVQTEIMKYSWYESLWKGMEAVFNLIILMLTALFEIIKNLIVGNGVAADVAGPVGIAMLTKQAATLGLIYVLNFIAILSVNLGIVNALPIPALDGGRILFILIEKIKGSPVTQKTEQLFHTVGFVLLILLMIAITFRDVAKIVK